MNIVIVCHIDVATKNVYGMMGAPLIEYSSFVCIYECIYIYIYIYVCNVCPAKPLYHIRSNFQGSLGMCCTRFLARKIGGYFHIWHVHVFVIFFWLTPWTKLPEVAGDAF